MAASFLLLILMLAAPVLSDDDWPNEIDGIHLADLINKLQGKPYYTYHRVGTDRTYTYHGAGTSDSGNNYGSQYGSNYYNYYNQNYDQTPRNEGYRTVWHNGAWRSAYLWDCRGRLYDYVGSTPRYYCDCGRLGVFYQLGACNAEWRWGK